MEAKDKAVEIFKKYYCMENNSTKKIKCIEFQTAKKCALILVDEILELKTIRKDDILTEYWEDVRFEIKRL